MKSLAILLAAAALSMTSAAAQVSSPVPPGPQRTEQPLRISSTFRTTLTMAPTQMVPDAAAQEAGRRALYAMAADECAALSEIFKGRVSADLRADRGVSSARLQCPARQHPERDRQL
jgi:hypothetical protein